MTTTFGTTTATRLSKSDLGELSATAFGDYLDQRVLALLATVEASEAYRTVFDVKADPRYIATAIKYVLLEVFSYGPHVTEATFTAIGRFPKKEVKLMEKLALHDVEEADHGEMALADAVKLGLDEKWARALYHATIIRDGRSSAAHCHTA
jgi:hypothetical protein